MGDVQLRVERRSQVTSTDVMRWAMGGSSMAEPRIGGGELSLFST